MSDLKISLDCLSKKEREVCEICNASGATHIGMIPIPICKPADLEKRLGRTPTYGECGSNGIKTAVIPSRCPNGYLNSTSRPIK